MTMHLVYVRHAWLAAVALLLTACPPVTVPVRVGSPTADARDLAGTWVSGDGRLVIEAKVASDLTHLEITPRDERGDLPKLQGYSTDLGGNSYLVVSWNDAEDAVCYLQFRWRGPYVLSLEPTTFPRRFAASEVEEIERYLSIGKPATSPYHSVEFFRSDPHSLYRQIKELNDALQQVRARLDSMARRENDSQSRLKQMEKRVAELESRMRPSAKPRDE